MFGGIYGEFEEHCKAFNVHVSYVHSCISLRRLRSLRRKDCVRAKLCSVSKHFYGSGSQVSSLLP